MDGHKKQKGSSGLAEGEPLKVLSDISSLAAEAWSGLRSRGAPPTPVNFQRWFLRVAEDRGVAAERIAQMLPDPTFGQLPQDFLAGREDAWRELFLAALDLAEICVAHLQGGRPRVARIREGLRPDVDESTLAALQATLAELAEELREDAEARESDGTGPGPGSGEEDLDRADTVVDEPPGPEETDLQQEATLPFLGLAGQEQETRSELRSTARDRGTQERRLRSAALDHLPILLGKALRVLKPLRVWTPWREDAIEEISTVLESGEHQAALPKLAELFDILADAMVAAREVAQLRTEMKATIAVLLDVLRIMASRSSRFHEYISSTIQGVAGSHSLAEFQQVSRELLPHMVELRQEMSERVKELDRTRRQVQAYYGRLISLEDELARQQEITELDPLTEIPNRRGLETWVRLHLGEGEGAAGPFCVLVVDLDRFKRVNDEHGHLSGDAVLVETAARLRFGVRANDFLCRYGGEEFCIILPGGDLSTGAMVAQRICHGMRSRPMSLPKGGAVLVTASVGIAEQRSEESFSAVFGRADKALHRAKGAGRDRWEVDTSMPSASLQGTPGA